MRTDVMCANAMTSQTCARAHPVACTVSMVLYGISRGVSCANAEYLSALVFPVHWSAHMDCSVMLKAAKPVNAYLKCVQLSCVITLVLRVMCLMLMDAAHASVLLQPCVPAWSVGCNVSMGWRKIMTVVLCAVVGVHQTLAHSYSVLYTVTKDTK